MFFSCIFTKNANPNKISIQEVWKKNRELKESKMKSHI